MAHDTVERDDWPALPYENWADTLRTLHLWTQVVGKVRMVRSPWQNHSWHVTLSVTSRGLGTGPIPMEGGSFSLDFDVFDHALVLQTSRGERWALPLRPMSTASFYGSVMEMLNGAGCPTRIHVMPNEIEDAVPFSEDEEHTSYDPDAVHRFWRVLHSTDQVFRNFRSRFWGKASPSHFFWGSFDLAVTRFSGRKAPDHAGGLPNLPLWVAQEAYSHEVSSAGFWPGGDVFPEPIFYSYAYPTPEGMDAAPVKPAAACWSGDLGEFVLPLDAVRSSPDPSATLMDFLETTFEAAAVPGAWDMTGQGRRHFPTAVGEESSHSA